MNLLLPTALAAALAGVGVYGILARRNAVMVLIGAELLINAGVLVLVITDVRAAAAGQAGLLAGQVGALFAITIAAAEIGLALAVVLLLFRTRRSVDVTRLDTADGEPDDGPPDTDQSAGGQSGDGQKAARTGGAGR